MSCTAALLKIVSPFGKAISECEESNLYWTQARNIIGCHPTDDDRILSLRLVGDKLKIISASGDVAKLKGLTSSAIDPDDGFKIYVAPTRHAASNMSIADCKKKFRHTSEHAFPTRVAVVFDEARGIDGVDLGIYKAHEYAEGGGNFMIMVRCDDGDEAQKLRLPPPSSIGKAVMYDGKVYRSHQEARVAVLLHALDIPFLNENEFETRVSTPDGHKYDVDFKIYPTDKDRVAYLEVKPHKPTRGEIMKAVALFKSSDVPVFIVWGKYFVQSIGVWVDKHPSNGCATPKYADGIQAMCIHREEQSGRVVCEEGYYFMASDLAEGIEWGEETERIPACSDVLPIDADAMLRHLDGGTRRFGPKRRARLGLTRKIQKSVRLVSKHTQKCYKPTDGFKAHLFKDVVDGERRGVPPDPFSSTAKAAFALAENYRFDQPAV